MRHRVAEGDDFTDFVTGEIHKFCLAHQNLLMLFFYRYIFNDCIRQSPVKEKIETYPGIDDYLDLQERAYVDRKKDDENNGTKDEDKICPEELDVMRSKTEQKLNDFILKYYRLHIRRL